MGIIFRCLSESLFLLAYTYTQSAHFFFPPFPSPMTPNSIVERHPIIMKEPEDWEAAYLEMQEEIMKHGKVCKTRSHAEKNFGLVYFLLAL